MLPLTLLFWALVFWTWFRRGSTPFRKERGDWALDLMGLGVQGTLIPWTGVALLHPLLREGIPQAEGILVLPALFAFSLNFVGVDFLYYWNHRALHHPRLWPVHAVHHTVSGMDVFGTSRNTLWTSWLILYVWVNGIFLYLLRDPLPYAASVLLTAGLDLWRHSGAGPSPGGRLEQLISKILITPSGHAWHHARMENLKNFGANLSVWDRLHGTFQPAVVEPPTLGIPLIGSSVWARALWPWLKSKGEGPE